MTGVQTCALPIYSTEENNWIIDNNIVEKARQFAFDGKTWMFDPSISLALVKGDKVTSAFYQAMTDWVKENKGAEYVTSYGNNDYYYGGSAYQNNFDFRAAKWREQNAAAYEDLTDDQLSALMFDRLPEAFLPGLEATYPNATTVDGVHVYYTITFSIYNITGTTQWTIKYEVTGKSEFTYVEDSLQEIA